MSESLAIQANTVLTLLRRLPPRERLRVIAQALPETEREMNSATSREVYDNAQSAAETQFKQTLLEMGLLTEIKDPTLYPMSTERIAPVTVEGTPLSEMIVAERR